MNDNVFKLIIKKKSSLPEGFTWIPKNRLKWYSSYFRNAINTILKNTCLASWVESPVTYASATVATVTDNIYNNDKDGSEINDDVDNIKNLW